MTPLSARLARRHASVGGRNRLQWSTCYVLDPATTEEERAVSTYLASQFVADLQLDYDPRNYPYYGDPFRSSCPPRWSAQLDRLGHLPRLRRNNDTRRERLNQTTTAGALRVDALRQTTRPAPRARLARWVAYPADAESGTAVPDSARRQTCRVRGDAT